jgi:ribosomal protein S18 acetylase RimI-like enzyme
MDPFIGEICLFGGNFTPKDWAFCEGQVLPIAENSALFAVLGASYGGYGLYGTTRAWELAAWGWEAAAQAASLDQQFRAQRSHCQRLWPQARDEIVELADQPVGRRLIVNGERELRLVDIAVLPDHQGQSLGSDLLLDLMDQSARNGRTLRLTVWAGGQAQRLYQRLGLRATPAGESPYLEMEWRGAWRGQDATPKAEPCDLDHSVPVCGVRSS